MQPVRITIRAGAAGVLMGSSSPERSPQAACPGGTLVVPRPCSTRADPRDPPGTPCYPGPVNRRAVAVVGILLIARLAAGDGATDEARRLYELGEERFQAGQMELAIEAFEHGYA